MSTQRFPFSSPGEAATIVPFMNQRPGFFCSYSAFAARIVVRMSAEVWKNRIRSTWTPAARAVARAVVAFISLSS